MLPVCATYIYIFFYFTSKFFLSSYTGFYGDKISFKNIKFFDKIFVPTFCRRRFRYTLYGEKVFLDGKMLCFGHGFDKLV